MFCGLLVELVLLSVPPPEVIDHAPFATAPLTLAPLNVIAEGEDDWQTVFGPPATTTADWFTVTDEDVEAEQLVEELVTVTV